MVCTLLKAPSPVHRMAKTNPPAYACGTMPQAADRTPIPISPIKEILIFRFAFMTPEKSSEDVIIPTAKASSTALPYPADNPN